MRVRLNELAWLRLNAGGGQRRISHANFVFHSRAPHGHGGAHSVGRPVQRQCEGERSLAMEVGGATRVMKVPARKRGTDGGSGEYSVERSHITDGPVSSRSGLFGGPEPSQASETWSSTARPRTGFLALASMRLRRC